MANVKLRRRIAWEAALSICRSQNPDYHRAKILAARRVARGWVKPADLPSNAEIREEIQTLIVRSSILGQAAEQAREAKVARWLGQTDSNETLSGSPLPESFDSFQVYEALLLPLESVEQSPRSHPEGDALYHSLQVFDLARDALPYDEELLLAALLHDVGKTFDPQDHVAAGLESLDGLITERTAWFIRFHTEAMQIKDGTLGARALRRLKQSGDYDELVILGECDRQGRQPGVRVPELREALEYLRELAEGGFDF